MTLTFFNNLTPGSCYTLKLRVSGICLLTEVLQTWKVRWTDRLTDTVGRWTWWFHYASFKTYTLASVIKNLQKWSIPWIYPKPQYFMVQNKFLKKSLRTQPKWYFKGNRGSSRDALYIFFCPTCLSSPALPRTELPISCWWRPVSPSSLWHPACWTVLWCHFLLCSYCLKWSDGSAVHF